MKHQSSLITFDREFKQYAITLSEQLQAKKPLPIVVNGLHTGACTDLCCQTVIQTKAKTNRPVLLLVTDEKEAGQLTDSLCHAGISACVFPSRDLLFDFVSASHDLERERLFVLSKLQNHTLDAVVTTAPAALTYTMPPSTLHELTIQLDTNDSIEPTQLSRQLQEMGYVMVETVESAGQFTKRGGILDIFTSAMDYPVRVEFFGDEIDRMGYFDPTTQRVFENIDTLTILPAREVITTPDGLAKVKTHIKTQLKKATGESTQKALQKELAAIEGQTDLYSRDKYISLLTAEKATLFDYIGSAPLPICLVGSSEIFEGANGWYSMQTQMATALIEDGLVGGKYAEYSQTPTYLQEILTSHVPIYLNQFSGVKMSMACAGLFGFRCRHTSSYRDNFRQLREDLEDYRKTGYRTLILCPTAAEIQPLISALEAEGIPAGEIGSDTALDQTTFPLGAVRVGEGDCRSGYDLPNPKVALLSMGEDSGLARRRRLRAPKKRADAGERIVSSAELKVGDLVVHQTYGIGKFLGIQNTTIDGISHDYITIQYAGTDQLLVPADRLELISKYIGAGSQDGTAKLSKMGGAEWQRAKSRAKGAAKEIAKELIALYAARERLPGFAFPPDSDLEKEFAAAFEFEETDPQLAAAEDIQADMMRPTPMDRLLCGDVGFGKTEVALRAAFKAICGGKQVAFLVPTTILALQHYQTALSRMRGFPVTVEMLSSFRTPSEQTKILRKLKRGDVDMLIGTHSLLSRRVEWKDLGLLIVDEEQRFGVAQKERLKHLSQGVDVLTLTATPIPRTLHMSLSGIRDMSILDEAPGDRFPVQTYVLEHDSGVLEEAMRREMRRGGQVLYLHNRTDSIVACASKIARAIPEARVTWAHGQMEKNELEQIWQALVRGEIDILVCTTIIETGIDLPNANTLIIEDADRMGLSQLHQIRGRVGRSGRRAYAYFTFRPGKALSDVATKRLSAIREYAEFGAGFRIAMKDLEIRGAGNLLGAEQHGNIDSVGYDLYVRLLREAILEEQGTPVEKEVECVVDVRADALIPANYIASGAHRMDMYKKISHIHSEEDRRDILDEFYDRFGDPPDTTVRLTYVSLLRALGAKAGMTKIEQREGEIRFRSPKLDLSIWSELFATTEGLRLLAGVEPAVCLKLKRGEDATATACAVMIKYDALQNETTEAKGDMA